MNDPLCPPKNCRRCPRLVEYRTQNKQRHPDWFNGAVPCFGDTAGRLLIVGLAPGLAGANRTGRPFTGDFAGDLLYATLTQFGFANQSYRKRADDGLALYDCMITNAVRCVPPGNKPIGEEITQCRRFLQARIESQNHLQIILALGRIAHNSVVHALGARQKDAPFAHGARHALGNRLLYDSYHCSRYNTNTGRLKPQQFAQVFENITAQLKQY